MTVTQQDFEALPVTPYSEARSLLRTGDILLFHSSGLMSEAIEHFTDSLWSHAGCLLVLKEIDRVFVMESVEKVGVRMMPLSSRVNGLPDSGKPYSGKLLVARHDDFPSEDTGKVSQMTRVALERLGYPYSPGELIKIAERIAAGFIGRVLPGELKEDTRYICSEYVAMCYQSVGIPILPDKKGFMAPADIAEDPHVKPVVSLQPDASASQ